MSAQRVSRAASPQGGKAHSGGKRAVSKPKAAQTDRKVQSKTPSRSAGGKASSATKAAAGAKASGAKASASRGAGAFSRSAARSKVPATSKKKAAVKSMPAKGASRQGRRSGGIVKRGLRAFAQSYLVRFVAVLVLVVAAVFVAVSAFSAQSNAPAAQRADGLPIYITDEMIDAARAMRHEYGHPAGCTIAQIIQESGQGTSLSMLAERDNNLFGMKWADSFSGKHGVVGPVQWGTNEEYDGKTVSIEDAFVKFESKKACIEFRSSVFLQSSTYADNPTIRRAIETNNSALMAWGLQDAGWATDSSYAEHLVSIMDQYDLYRFDS